MNKEQRQRFINKMATKYSIGVDVAQQRYDWDHIREMDIFSAIRNIPNVFMLAGSYSRTNPSISSQNIGHEEVREPWGPTIVFRYQSKAPPEKYQQDGKQYATTPTSGDPNLIRQVEAQLQSKLGTYIHSIGTDYKGNGIYEVTVTTKRRN